MFDDAANDLRERLYENAIDFCSMDGVYTHSSYESPSDWICMSYSDNNHNISFFGLSTGEAAELIRTFDAMQMAKAMPMGARNP